MLYILVYVCSPKPPRGVQRTGTWDHGAEAEQAKVQLPDLSRSQASR